MTSQDPRDVPPIEGWHRLLDGRVAVVSGGGAGIGGAVSRLFAEHGAHVEIAEIDSERAEKVVSEIIGAGGSARAHVIDVRLDRDVARLAAAVIGDSGPPAVLVNNVGDYRPPSAFVDSTPANWRAMYDVNLHHQLSMTHAFLGPMIDNGGGSIVNIHSVEGMRGFPLDPVYGAMKAASAHFTTCLATGYGRHGIRANGIGPDLIQTPQVDYLAGSGRSDGLWESWAPVGRVGWPIDVARVALFLASDLSAFVTGQNIAVDGGTSAGGGWFYSPDAQRFVNRPRNL